MFKELDFTPYLDGYESEGPFGAVDITDGTELRMAYILSRRLCE